MNTTAQETVDALMVALQYKGDLPSLSSTLSRIVTSMQSEGHTDDKLVDAVLSDVALTQKVLRLANSSMYAAFGGSVTTVSAAVFILGTEVVGHLAMGLKLIENLGQTADTALASLELSKVVMSSVIARHVGVQVLGREAEATAVAALLRGFGKLLVCFYLADKFEQIQARRPSPDEEDMVSTEVLGLSYGEIALHVCAQWDLPMELSKHVVPVAADGSLLGRVHAMASYAQRYVYGVCTDASPESFATLAERFSGVIGLQSQALHAAAECAMQQAEGDLHQSDVVRALKNSVYSTPCAPFVARTSLQRLTSGYAELCSMAPTLKTPQLTSMACETLLGSLDCTRTLFYLRRSDRKCYELVMGLGAGVSEQVRRNSFEEDFSPNVFHLALSRSLPVYLADVTEPNIAQRLPSSYAQAFKDTRSMLLVPLGSARRPVGLLCLDWGSVKHERALNEEELSYLERIKELVEKAFGCHQTLE